MANKLLIEAMRDKVRAAIKDAKRAADVDHPGMKGSIREIALKKLFKPLLTMADLGSGKIIDWKGTQSQQTDVIIYSKEIHTPFLYDEHGDMGLYPAETCLYAIEVKSKVTAEELKDALHKAKTLRKIEYLPGFFDASGKPLPHNITYIVPAFFAFGSDLTGAGKSELDRYLELDQNGDYDPLIRAICIIGKGYWFFRKEASESGTRCAWYYGEPTGEHDEAVSFLGTVINTLPNIIASRGHPALGPYIVPSSFKCVRNHS